MYENVQSKIKAIFTANQEADAVFTALMPALCNAMKCDRCFLYIRHPPTQQGCITHCYSRNPDFPNLAGANWIEEGDIAAKDPLMAIAFRTPEAVFVDDIETAGVEVVNLLYEQQVFGHRALIHAPVYQNGHLYGVLEPCVFEHPRVWTKSDRSLTAFVQDRLGSLVVSYLEHYL